jgi:hypothetical protein
MNSSEIRPLFQLEQKLGRNWKSLRAADTASTSAKKEVLDLLEAEVGRFSTEDAIVAVFGSLARCEWISGESDLDWTCFVDGQANSFHLKMAQQIKEALQKKNEKFREPGRTGTFGNLAFSHQLVHLIGDLEDTNKNMTQRILLLLESVPIGRQRTAYDDYLSLVSNPQSREELKHLSATDARESWVFGRVREISGRFEEGLNSIFFKNDRLRPLTEKYGVF